MPFGVIALCSWNKSETCLKQPLKIDKIKVLKPCENLMQVKVLQNPVKHLQYFWPALRDYGLENLFFGLLLSGCLKQVLLYVIILQWPGHMCLLDTFLVYQGSQRLEKYLNIQDCLEKSLKIKFALKSNWKTLKGLEKSLNFTIYRSFGDRNKNKNCGAFIWCSICCTK